MTTFRIDVDDHLAGLLDELLPDGVDADDWLAMKAEEAIMVQQSRQNALDIQRAAQDGVPDDLLVTNDDIQAARADGDADVQADD